MAKPAKLDRSAVDLGEEMLMDALEMLGLLPDAERAFLSSGSRSCWPAVVRDRITDYAETQARRQLTRREVDEVNRMFITPGCMIQRIEPRAVRVLAVALPMKCWPDAGGFRWERVWEMMGGRGCDMTSDTVRGLYEGACARVAAMEMARLDAL